MSLPGSAVAADFYYANASAGSNNGTSCANAYAWTDGTNGINTAGKWVAGNVLHLCGTITGTNGANGIVAAGSGASGNPVTIKFETGAILQAGWFGSGENNGNPSSAGILLNGRSNIVVDGGTNGLIRNTLSGTAGIACPGGTCQDKDSILILLLGCSNCTVQNLEIGPAYVRANPGGSEGAGVSVWLAGGNGTATVTNTHMHGGSAAIEYQLDDSATNGAFTLSNNEINDVSAGINIFNGSTNSTASISSTSISGNRMHDFWQDGGGYFHHNDGIHVALFHQVSGPINIWNNEFYGNQAQATAWIYFELGVNGTQTINIFNNWIHSCANAGTSGAGGSHFMEFEFAAAGGGNGPANVKVFNNTGWGVGGCPNDISNGIFNNGATLSTWTILFNNNIFGGSLGGIAEGSFTSGGTGNIFDCTSVSNGMQSPTFSCGTPPNLSATQRIQNTSSSAYHTGTNLTGNPNANINTDAVGNLRPASGAWDAGAFQFVTSSATLANNPTAIAFGNQQSGTSSTAQAVVVTNSGGAAATSVTCSITGPNANQFVITDPGNCPTSLSNVSGSNTFTIHVQFSPNAVQSDSANLTVSFTGGSSSTTLSGTGTASAAPLFSLSPTSIQCGSSNLNIQAVCPTITVTNTGTKTATISTKVVSPNTNFAETDTCGATLAVNASCTITPTFTPTTSGALIATFTITDTPDSVSGTATLNGTGVNPNAITVIQQGDCGPTSSVTQFTCTLSQATSANTVVAIGIMSQFGLASLPTVVSIIDPVHDAYAEAQNSYCTVTSSNGMADIWWTNGAGGAVSFTPTMSIAGQYVAHYWEFSNVNSQDAGANLSNQATSTTPVGAPVTTQVSNEAIVSLLQPLATTTGIFAGNPFTNDSLLFANGWAHLITSSSGTYQAKWNTSGGAYCSSTASWRFATPGINSPGGLTVSGSLSNGVVH